MLKVKYLTLLSKKKKKWKKAGILRSARPQQLLYIN